MDSRLATLIIALAAAVSAFGGPTVNILGDSFSTYDGAIPEGYPSWYHRPPRNQNDVTNPSQCWWSIVIDKLGGKLLRNESWSGSTICNCGFNGSDTTETSFVSRVCRLDKSDVVIILGGINDSWSHAGMGKYVYENWGRDDLYYFRPATAKTIDFIRTRMPGTKIVFVLYKAVSKEIAESVHTICDHYGVTCVEVSDVETHGAHPTVAGMKRIADCVMKAFK